MARIRSVAGFEFRLVKTFSVLILPVPGSNHSGYRHLPTYLTFSGRQRNLLIKIFKRAFFYHLSIFIHPDKKETLLPTKFHTYFLHITEHGEWAYAFQTTRSQVRNQVCSLLALCHLFL